MDRKFGGSRFGGGRDFGGRGRGGDDRRGGGGFRSGGGDSFEKPVKVGETYDVEIKEVGTRGDGIARVKNFVVFVAGATKGEKCTIKITSVSQRFAVGEKTTGKATGEAMEKESMDEEMEEETEEE